MSIETGHEILLCLIVFWQTQLTIGLGVAAQ
jgi:hypothetical protein